MKGVTNPNPENTLESGTQVNKHWLQHGFLRIFCLKLVFLSICMFYAILLIRVLVMTSMMMNVKWRWWRLDVVATADEPGRIFQGWGNADDERLPDQWGDEPNEMGSLVSAVVVCLAGPAIVRFCQFGRLDVHTILRKGAISWWSWMSSKR